MEIETKKGTDSEVEIVVFLSDRDYHAKDKVSGIEVPIKAYSYYNLETNQASELSIRHENLTQYGADKIAYADETWTFPVFAISREWQRSKNYQNLKLVGINATGKFMQLVEKKVIL